MVRILCCSASVFSVATGAQICANSDQFDESVICVWPCQDGSTCGEMLLDVTDFVPSATTCSETVTFDEEEYTRLQFLFKLTSCCKDGKTSCHDYMPPVCKNMNKFDGSVEMPDSLFKKGNCGHDAVEFIDPFSPSATTCQADFDMGYMKLPLSAVLVPMAVCCEDGETACSDFHAQICKIKENFDGSVDSGVKMMDSGVKIDGMSCSLLSSMMDAFVPSKATCSEQITMPGVGGGNMSRMLVLEQLASCCNDGNTACVGPWPTTTIVTTTIVTTTIVTTTIVTTTIVTTTIVTTTIVTTTTVTTMTGASSNAVKQVCFSAVLITAALML